MSRKAAPRLYSRFKPHVEFLGRSYQFWVDYENESLKHYDGNGVTHEFPIAMLNGKTLTHCMMLGLIHILKESADPHTAWLALLRGFRPRSRRKAYAPTLQQATLSKERQAVVEAILAYGGTTTRESAEARVRSLTHHEIKLWHEEPDVILHYRELRGDTQLRLRLLAEELQSN